MSTGPLSGGVKWPGVDLTTHTPSIAYVQERVELYRYYLSVPS